MSVHVVINVLPYHARPRLKHMTYQQVKKACGKPTCRVCGGIRPRHGPYWYKIEWEARAHKQRTTYIGKTLPAAVQEAWRWQQALMDPTVRQQLEQTQHVAAALARQQQINAALRARVAELEAALAAALTPRGPGESLPPAEVAHYPAES